MRNKSYKQKDPFLMKIKEIKKKNNEVSSESDEEKKFEK
jgi:hypothetical protein